MVVPRALTDAEKSDVEDLNVDEDKIYPISKRCRNFSHLLIHSLYEPVSLQEYDKFFFNSKTPVAVLKTSLVVSTSFPVLGATLDPNGHDFECLLCFCFPKVKCLHTKFHATLQDACSDPDLVWKRSMWITVHWRGTMHIMPRWKHKRATPMPNGTI